MWDEPIFVNLFANDNDLIGNRWQSIYFYGIIFKRIAKDLKVKYGKGFSRSNVIYMRLLYLKYPKSQTVSDQLSWSVRDNEPLGIVLGAEKHRVLVEYALGGISNKLFASKYRLSLPDKQLLQKAVEKIIYKAI